MTDALHVPRLTEEQAAEVFALAAAASGTDGAPPLSEHFVLRLRGEGRHLLLRASGALVGYAGVDGSTAELVVHPLHRRRGYGRILATAVLGLEGSEPMRIWAHGDHPSASALALALGFNRQRTLFQLRRSLAAPVPEPVFPDGVELRAFVPGRDDAAWLGVNSRAFASHPEQGKWTQEDLELRQGEPWFDPAGFFLAVRGTEILGYHWTKVVGGIGEVYVLGIDPAAQGLGLGRSLTLVGLRHLRGLGLGQVMLYVDEDNPVAVRLYEKQGFLRWATDVCFEHVRA